MKRLLAVTAGAFMSYLLPRDNGQGRAYCSDTISQNKVYGTVAVTFLRRLHAMMRDGESRSIAYHRRLPQIGGIGGLFENEIREIGARDARAGIDTNPADTIVAGVRPIVQHWPAHDYPVQVALANRHGVILSVLQDVAR